MNPLFRCVCLLLLGSAMGWQTLSAQTYLILTPEPHVYLQGEQDRAARYQIEATTSFVDALVAAHLEGDITLYRDVNQVLPFPGRAAFDAYLSDLRHPTWDARLAEMAQEEGIRDTLAAMNRRKAACETCLSLSSRWLLTAGGDSATLYPPAKSPEEQLSLYKQLGKSRNTFERMAGIDPMSFHRYLLMTAKLEAGEEQHNLDLTQGVLLLSYYPNGDPNQAPKESVIFFDPQEGDIPWFLLKTHALAAGIQEEMGAKALLDEHRIDLTPLGYRMITEEETGPWIALWRYPADDTLMLDSLRKDSTWRSWNLGQTLIRDEQLVQFYPRQSKAVSLWLDGRWNAENLGQQALNNWALEVHEELDWDLTQTLIETFTADMLADLSAGLLPLFKPGDGGADMREGKPYTFTEMLADRDQAAMAWMPAAQPQRTRSIEATPDSQVLPPAWKSSEKQSYSWRLRGDLVWLQGLQTFQPLWLDLFWHPPVTDSVAAGPHPMLSIAWDNLSERNYQWDEKPLTDVLRSMSYGYYLSQINETRFQDLNHATMYQQILSETAWDAFPDWLIHGQSPPGADEDLEEAWEDAWRTIRRNIRRSVYRD